MRPLHFVCRRRNFIQAACVNAALEIKKVLGTARAADALLRERVPVEVIERVLDSNDGAIRQRRQPAGAAMAASPAALALIQGYTGLVAPSELRNDLVTAQHIEVALVFQAMMDTRSAAEYLSQSKVSIWVATRVLATCKRRPSPMPCPVDN